ncbi:MAG: hypothetical protein E7236_07175 [Lachnospiraceae bacterium]|nr:hypothetical protein [Lachnospiraceae bacterium]
MKNKKVAALLLTMALCAGMAMPQSVVAFAAESTISEATSGLEESASSTEAGSSDGGQEANTTDDSSAESEDSGEDGIQGTDEVSYYDSGKVKEAYCSDTDSLKTALANASTTADEVSTIYITQDIDLALGATEYLEVPAKTYVEIKSTPGSDKPYCIKNKTASACLDKENCMFYVHSAKLIFSDIILDAGGNRRCISYFANKKSATANAEITLNSGTTIQNGGNATTTALGGLGIYVDINTNKTVNVILNEGSKITGCNANCKYGSIHGKAIDNEKTGGIVYIKGGDICNNDDLFDESANYSLNMNSSCSLGAVYCTSLNMTGGKIYNNNSLGVGGVYLTGSKESIISGGCIENNIVDTSKADEIYKENVSNSQLYSEEAGGVYVTGGHILTIAEDASIKGNRITGMPTQKKYHRVSGGGIKVSGNSTVKMTGGEITDNTVNSSVETFTAEECKNIAVANGGGVYVQSGTFEMTGGTITGNTATAADSTNTQAGNGGGVYVATDGTVASGTGATFTMSGGTISNNTATRGKDVYVSNYLKYLKSSVTNGVTTYTALDVAGTPSVTIGGKVDIGDIYLPASSEVTGKAELTIADSLAGSNIGITPENAVVNTVIATAAKDYEGLSVDANMLKTMDAKTMRESATVQAGYDETQESIVLKEKALSSESIAKAEIGAITEYTYDGTEKKPQPTVTLNGVQLTKKEYSYAYMNNKNAGTATVIVSGNSPYTDWTLKDFVIKPLSIKSDSISAETLPDRYFTGEEIIPADVNLMFNGAKLEKDKDYTLEYHNNTNVGTASVTVTGKGNFTGERELTFKIKEVEEEATAIEDGAALKKSIESLEPGETSKSNPAKYTLTKNISIDEGIKVPEGQYVEIYGNHMTMTSGKENYAVADESGTATERGMFVVSKDASLTLSDKMTLDGKYQERLVYVCEGGTFEAEKGVTLTGGRATDQNVTKEGNVTTLSDVPEYGGQCIYNLGTTVFDGTISDNVTKANGYGAIYNNGSFTLGKDSVLKNILVNAYGAFYNDTEGKAVMEGGTISGNACEQTYLTTNAKGIFNLGTFTMKDGAVKENEGQYSVIANCGAFIMEGGSIVDNKNDFKTVGGAGDGAILQRTFNTESAEPTFLMTGGEIVGNESMYRGGGVFVANGTFTVDGENAVIKDNTVTSKGNEDNFGSYTVLNNGGGVYVQGGTFELKKGTIEGNEAYLKTESATQKQAFNGGSWYYNSNGTPTATSGQTMGNSKDKHYGLGGAIYVDGGKLKLSGGDVKGNISVPLNKDNTKSAFEAASGIYVADGSVEMSGAPVVSDVIYLEQEQNITITGKLTGTEPYTVYQTENDLKLKEDCSASVGNAVATYAQESDAYQETDGDHFKLYAYDDTYDYAANKAYTHYTAFADDGIYVNIDDIDISKLKYYFANADMTTGIPSYVYNGAAQTVKISAPVEGWLDEKGNIVDAGGSLAFTVDQNAIVNAGPYNVAVKPDSSKPGGYHYTGEASLQFAITPRDLSVRIYEYDNDGNLKTDENGNHIVDRLYETSYSFKDDISYGVNDPDEMEYMPTSEVQVHLASLYPTTLVEGTDYKVTYSNNKSGSKENITATITGIGNYQGVLAKNVDTGIKVKDDQTLTTSVKETNVTAGDKAFSLGASSSDTTATLTYKSSDESIATVDANGQVTPLGKGTVQITVTASETATSRPAQQEVTFNVAANPAVVDQEAADNVTRLVNNLNTDAMTVDNLSTSKTSVDHARAAYEALTEAQKEKVPQDTLNKLTAAEQKIKALEDEAAAIEKQKADQAAAAKVEEALNALLAADQMNADNYADAVKAITAAESAYNTLTDAQKAYVSADAKEKLNAAKAKAGEIEAQMNQDAVDLAKAQAVSDQIAKMPNATEISKQTITEDEAAVKAARAAYDALTDAQKDKVPQEALAALVAAENKVAEVQKAIADAAAAEIPEISLVQTQNNAVKPVTNADGSQGLALDLDENGQIIITLGDNTHPILDAENKAIDNDYVFGTAVEEINKNGDVIPSDLEVAEIFNIDWYVNGEKQEFDDSMYVTFGAASVKASDTKVIVLHQHDGKWTQLAVAGYGDGWVKAKFDGFSPAVVLVAHSASEDTTGGSDTSGTGGSTDTSGSGTPETGGSDAAGTGGNTDTTGNDGSSSTSNGGSGDTSGNNGSDNGTTGDNGSGNTTDGTTTDNTGDTNAGTTTQGGTVQGATSPYTTAGQSTWSGTGTGTTATPVSSTAATNAVSTPKTGDRTNMPAAYATLLAALAALFGAGFVNKRRREEETE